MDVPSQIGSATNAVVTGAASGIGEATAQRLLEAGASVVIGDLDASRLEATATRLDGDHPGRVAHVAGDASDTDHIAALIAAAGDPVNLYVANAGVFRGFGLEATDDEWASSWDVNVMAHVRAARALVPQWLEGDGRLFRQHGVRCRTADSAGFADVLDSKHAAVGFAEWLAATYGDLGVQVCCLCPMGVRTDMLKGGETASDDQAALGMKSVTSAGETLEPLVVADVLLEAITAGRFFALPHPDVGAMYARKAADADHWITGMQRFRTALEG